MFYCKSLTINQQLLRAEGSFSNEAACPVIYFNKFLFYAK